MTRWGFRVLAEFPGGWLSLAPEGGGPHSPCAVKLSCAVLLAVGCGLTLSACETVDDRRAGGGAFGNSYLGKRLDSNNPDLDDNPDERGKTAPPSYQRWRNE